MQDFVHQPYCWVFIDGGCSSSRGPDTRVPRVGHRGAAWCDLLHHFPPPGGKARGGFRVLENPERPRAPLSLFKTEPSLY